MNDSEAHPEIVSRQEWLLARKELLQQEKELSRRRDAVSSARRRLPMVEVEKKYIFDSTEGRKTLADLFGGRKQLIVYHFMFDPDGPPPGKSGAPWEEGCPGCSHMLDSFPHLSHLHARNTSLVVVSRAPMSKILPFKKRMGWNFPWYSSFGTEFNYDYHVTADANVSHIEYNYETQESLKKKGQAIDLAGELPGVSVFLAYDNRIFHTYSTYARGLDMLVATYNFLDLTPFGRQEEWEDSPDGWPQSATHGWLRHHDKYESNPESVTCCCEPTANKN